MRCLTALLLFCLCASLQASERPAAALKIDVSHVARDTWRVDYRFARPVSAIKLAAVGDYRQQAWTIRSPELRLQRDQAHDVIVADQPFTRASVEIRTFDGLAPKDYAPFNRFSDGGTAIFLGHLQGEALQGGRTLPMLTDITLHGLAREHVIAPPANRQQRGGARGYAYFGPARPVGAGASAVLLDPATPEWARETVLATSAKMAAYYGRAYQRPLREPMTMLLSVAGFDSPGLSMKGGAVLGQLSYRLEGKALLGDHPKKRDLLARIVAHEMAHLWQLNIDRGGVGESDPWIHEGGAEAMALDGLQQTGILSADAVAAYRKAQTDACDKLDNAVDTYDGIYACGLARFDRLGVPIVPLWRQMMQASEAQGTVYSAPMIEAIAGAR